MPRFFAGVLLAIILPHLENAAADESNWTRIVNGNDLDGWYTYLQKHGKNSDPERIVTIDDGVIHLYKHAEHGSEVVQGYIGTDKEYSHYHLRVQYKWGEKKFRPRFEALRDAGIYYHMVGADRVWPRALQFQVLRTHVGDIVTVGHLRYDTTVDPATKDDDKPTFMSPENGGVPHTHGLHLITHLARRALHEQEDWNTIEIIVHGDRAEHRLNGHLVARLTKARQPDPNDPQRYIPLTKGRILLEIEAAEVFFRNVEIKLLDGTAE